MMNAEQLQAATGSTIQNAEKYLDALVFAMAKFEINTLKRKAAFLATVSVESAKLRAAEEGLYYSDPARLAMIFKTAFGGSTEAARPFSKNPAALSQKLYQGFHGRGLIQLTWERNYKACGDALDVDFVAKPDLLLTPKFAALSAGWYWGTNNCNAAADRGDMTQVTRIVNGSALMHLAERNEQYIRASSALPLEPSTA
jgi:putative chitinase